MGIIFALIYALLAGLGKVYLKKSQKNFPPSVSFFLETLTGISIWMPYGIYTGIDTSQIIASFPIVLLGAVLSEAYIFFIFSKGDASIIATVFSSFSIYTILFSFILLNERLSIAQLVAVGIVILGVISISLPNQKKKFIHQLSPVLWATSGAMSVGIADTLGKSVVDEISAGSFVFTLALAQIPVSLIYLKLERQSPKLLFKIPKEFLGYKYSLYSALLLGLAQLFFWLAFEYSDASIASPVATSSAMFTVLFSYILLKERLRKLDYLGSILVCFGVIILSIIQ